MPGPPRLWAAMCVGAVVAAGCGDDNGVSVADAGTTDAGSSMEIRVLLDQGGRVDWLARDPFPIAFDRRDPVAADGCSDVFTMTTDATDVRCVTCAHSDVPVARSHIGQPTWHHSGRYIVMQVENATHVPRCGPGASPGAGGSNDLWVLDLETDRMSLLYAAPGCPACGALHPHFSADGTMLSWAEMTGPARLLMPGLEFGVWRLVTARVVDTAGVITLSDIQTYEPLGTGRWYENHGFSPDNSRLYFTASVPGMNVPRHAETHSVVLATGATTALATDAYNEHATISPDGSRLVWMHGLDVNVSTEWWLSTADGASPRQLSTLTTGGCETWIAADLSWHPDGRRFIGYAHNLGALASGCTIMERIYLVTLPP